MIWSPLFRTASGTSTAEGGILVVLRPWRQQRIGQQPLVPGGHLSLKARRSKSPSALTLIVTLSSESGVKTISPSLTSSGSSTSPTVVAPVIATRRVPCGSRSVPVGVSDNRTSFGGSAVGLKATIASPGESGMYRTRRSIGLRVPLPYRSVAVSSCTSALFSAVSSPASAPRIFSLSSALALSFPRRPLRCQIEWFGSL